MNEILVSAAFQVHYISNREVVGFLSGFPDFICPIRALLRGQKGGILCWFCPSALFSFNTLIHWDLLESLIRGLIILNAVRLTLMKCTTCPGCTLYTDELAVYNQSAPPEHTVSWMSIRGQPALFTEFPTVYTSALRSVWDHALCILQNRDGTELYIHRSLDRYTT